MSRLNPVKWIAGMALGLGLCLSAGCQTFIGGMTLPSADYLKDNPDYIPKPPSFPLSRELAAMQSDTGEAANPQQSGRVTPPR
jgi:hypothetical protein